MEKETVTDASLRQFLLGRVDDEERQRIEKLVITNAVPKERVGAAEEDLLEDYLEDALSPSDRERFLMQYAYTSAQQRRLQITQDVKHWAITEQQRRITSKGQASGRSRSFAHFRLKPMFVMPMAAAVVVIVLVVFWVNRKIELRNRQFVLEEEIGRLNASSGSPKGQISSLPLRPVTLRSAATETELVIRPNIQVVELQLFCNQDESYSTYQAVLRRIGDAQSFNIRNLHPEPEGKAIRVRLPAQILTTGTYHLELTGLRADGRSGPMEEFQFSVRG